MISLFNASEQGHSFLILRFVACCRERCSCKSKDWNRKNSSIFGEYLLFYFGCFQIRIRVLFQLTWTNWCQLPAIEVIAKLPPVDRDQKRPPVNVLVICPTRELASQAATEAETLLKFHPSIGVQVVIGGTRLSLEQKRMQANPCQVK